MKTKRRLARRALPLLIAAVAAAASLHILDGSQPDYLTLNPSVSQRFVSIPSESSLVDLCYRLWGVYGVTGVTYRDYSPTTKSAMVTVFFDPQATSVRQVRIFMLHSRLLWLQEMKA